MDRRMCSQRKTPTKRYVSSMKVLLPLRLPFPGLPEVSVPSPECYRSTFGGEGSQKSKGRLYENQKLPSRRSKYVRLPVRVQTQRYQSIYYEPILPLPRNFYSASEDPQHEYASSIYDTSVDEANSPRTQLDEVLETIEKPPLVRQQTPEGNIIQDGLDADPNRTCEDRKISWSSNRTDVSRSSGLSFKCVGELFPNEAAWFGSPSTPRPPRCPSPHPEALSKSVTITSALQSWQSEHGLLEEDDMFVEATELVPSEAQVVNVNAKRHYGLAITIPPRTSSLTGIHKLPITPEYSGNSWMDLDDSPTAQDFYERYQISRDSSSMMGEGSPAAYSPGPLDITLHSPPISPIPYRKWPRSRPDSIAGSINSDQRDENLFSISNITPTFLDEIVTSLEQEVSWFPHSTLMHDAPLVLNLRAVINRSVGQWPLSNSPQFSPFLHYDTRKSPEYKISFSANQAPPNSYTSNMYNISSTCSPRSQSHRPSHSIVPEKVELPFPGAVEALQRILCGSQRQLSILYAHILAYLFARSLKPALEADSWTRLLDQGLLPESNGSLKADLQSPSTARPFIYHNLDDGDEYEQLHYRATILAEKLEKCICKLLQVIQNPPDGADKLDADLLQSLMKVVKGSEMQDRVPR